MAVSNMSGHFSLDMLERVAGHFSPPRESFRPAGAWENRYTLYCLVHNNRKKPVYGNPAGGLIIGRYEESGRRMLRIDYRKIMDRGLYHRIVGEIEILSDVLATPVRWTMTVEFARGDSPPHSWSQSEHGMRVQGGRLELSAAGSKRTLPRPAAYTSAWALLDAVQRMPRQAGGTLRFTFFDRNNAAKAGHILRYREAVEVESMGPGGSPVRLHGFEHLGDGFVPSVYWTGDSGRLLMFNHGLQGYVLQTDET